MPIFLFRQYDIRFVQILILRVFTSFCCTSTEIRQTDAIQAITGMTSRAKPSGRYLPSDMLTPGISLQEGFYMLNSLPLLCLFVGIRMYVAWTRCLQWEPRVVHNCFLYGIELCARCSEVSDFPSFPSLHSLMNCMLIYIKPLANSTSRLFPCLDGTGVHAAS